MNSNTTNRHRRNDYPSDGAVVEELIHNEDGTITILYDDSTYLTVRRVGS